MYKSSAEGQAVADDAVPLGKRSSTGNASSDEKISKRKALLEAAKKKSSLNDDDKPGMTAKHASGSEHNR